MQDKFELIVSLHDFINVIKGAKHGAKLGKRNIARESVEYRFDSQHLIITIADIDRPMSASGSWEGKVTVSLALMGRFSKAPPTQDPLIISYADSKLKIGTTSFPAVWSRLDTT
jgi:hypothetical protein